MGLNNQQFQFTHMVGQLIDFIYKNGYTATFGDAYATSGHINRSKHYDRLAVDLNLFRDGNYLTDTDLYRPLGSFWKAIGGTWGGDFRSKDGNHFSLGEK